MSDAPSTTTHRCVDEATADGFASAARFRGLLSMLVISRTAAMLAFYRQGFITAADIAYAMASAMWHDVSSATLSRATPVIIIVNVLAARRNTICRPT